MNSAINYFKQVLQNAREDEIVIRGAGISFFAVFSLPAAIILILAGIGFYLGDDVAQQYLYSFLNTILSKEGTNIISEVIPTIIAYKPERASSILGIVLLAISASALFNHLISSLNKIFPIPKRKGREKIIAFFTRRLISFVFVIFIMLLLFASFIADTSLALINDYFVDKIPYGINLVASINPIISILLTFALFLFTFKVLPKKNIPIKFSAFGALIATSLFILGRYFLIVGIQKFADFSAFGAASSLIFVLIWIFYSAIIVFFGAECTKTLMVTKKTTR